MSAELAALLATFGISLLSFVGLVLTGRLWNARIEMRLVSFAAGVLLATTFLDLLPEAVELSDGNTDILIGTLGAMAAFFYLERILHGRHRHTGGESHVEHHSASGIFILTGDGVHNFIDGVAIAAGFLISTEVGLVTTAAVAAHELPHEVGDYAVLTRSGFSRRKALGYNFLSGLSAVAGALATIAFQDFVTENLALLVAIVAGMFIYIAAANLIPELHHQRVKGRMLYGLPFLTGVLLIPGLLTVLPHEPVEDGRGQAVEKSVDSGEGTHRD